MSHDYHVTDPWTNRLPGAERFRRGSNSLNASEMEEWHIMLVSTLLEKKRKKNPSVKTRPLLKCVDFAKKHEEDTSFLKL